MCSNKYLVINTFLSCSMLLLVSSEEDYYKREHSLTRPYTSSGWQIPNWNFYGSTIISNDYVRITPDTASQVGGIWNSVPLFTPYWEIHLNFKVFGKSTSLFGDGMTLWVAKEPMSPGPVFGSKDLFYGLAIIIDTYSNHNGPHQHQHPYISAMINNGTLSYDHDRDGTLTQIAGCEESKLRGVESGLIVKYDKDVLSVRTNVNGWKDCFEVPDVIIPTGYFIGVTAATGDLSDNHDVISIKTYELAHQFSENQIMDRSYLVPASKSAEPQRDHHPDPPPSTSTFKIFFYTFLIIIVIIGGVIVSIIWYQNYQANSRKRFY